MDHLASRFVARLVAATTALLSGLVALVAFGAPAHAELSASVTWYSGADYATIQLNEDAVFSALNYDAGLGWGTDDLCRQIADTINGKRHAVGYTTDLSQSTCVDYVRDCAGKRGNNNRVQVAIYADLSHGCGWY